MMDLQHQKFDGKKVRDLRKQAGLNQKELADRICSVKKLSEIENEKTVPSVEIAQAIAQRLNVDLNSLILNLHTEELEDELPVEAGGGANGENSNSAPVVSLETFESFVAGLGVPTFEGGLPYLSRTERSNYVFLNAFVHKADQIAEEMKRYRGDPQHVLMFEIGSRLIAKGMAARCLQLERKAFLQFDRETKIRDVALMYRSDAKMYIKRYVEEDTRIRNEINAEMGGDPLHDLAEIVLVSHCRDCNGCARHEMKEGCPVYNALHALQVEEWDPAHPQCGYAFAGRLEHDNYERV